jgi:hypothetical protein
MSRTPQDVREEAVSDHFKFLEQLLQWHGGQGSGVYAVGSTWLAKMPVPSCEVERAIEEMRKCIEDPRLTVEERQEAFAVREHLITTALQEGMLVNVRRADTPYNIEARKKLVATIESAIPDEDARQEQLDSLCDDLAGILSSDANNEGINGQLEFLLSHGVPDGQILDNLGIRAPQEPEQPSPALE